MVSLSQDGQSQGLNDNARQWGCEPVMLHISCMQTSWTSAEVGMLSSSLNPHCGVTATAPYLIMHEQLLQ